MEPCRCTPRVDKLCSTGMADVRWVIHPRINANKFIDTKGRYPQVFTVPLSFHIHRVIELLPEADLKCETILTDDILGQLPSGTCSFWNYSWITTFRKFPCWSKTMLAGCLFILPSIVKKKNPIVIRPRRLG